MKVSCKFQKPAASSPGWEIPVYFQQVFEGKEEWGVGGGGVGEGGRVLGVGISQLKCDGTWAESRFRLSPKRTSPFKSAGASVQSTTGSRGVRISGSNAGYTMFRGSVKSTGYPLHSRVSPSLPLPCVTVCRHISTGPYTVMNFALSSRYPLVVKEESGFH